MERHETNDDHVHRRHIAIVGAGYAGLALTNLLLKQNSFQANPIDSVMIFDALHPPSFFVEGDLCVPIAKELYRNLDWTWPLSCKIISNDDSFIREEFLLQDLRKRPRVRYYHFCYKIEADRLSDNQLALHFLNRANGKVFCHPLRFDIVVLCHGVRSSSLLRQIPLKLDQNILVLGDARFYRIWDFGYLRLKQGANQAIKDAIEVSNLLRTNNSNDWGKYGLRFKRQSIMKQYIFLMCIFLSLIILWGSVLSNP
jgi:hypothetical protein